jgi:hypothetical protein
MDSPALRFEVVRTDECGDLTLVEFLVRDGDREFSDWIVWDRDRNGEASHITWCFHELFRRLAAEGKTPSPQWLKQATAAENPLSTRTPEASPAPADAAPAD